MFGITLNQLIVLGIWSYVMLKVIKKGDIQNKVLSTVFLWFVWGYIPDNFDIKESTDKLKEDIEEYQEASNINTNRVSKGPLDEVGGGEKGDPVSADSLNMSGYDGLCLKTGNREYWMKSPFNTALVSDDKLYTYLGSEGPIKMKISDQSALKGPPVDGVQGSPEKMFMWANNMTSPLCCPSTFSTSTGCLCTTENQRDFIASRGTLNDDLPNDSDL